MAALKTDAEKCCGCRICEMACSMTHLGLFNPSKALLRVKIDRLSKVPSQVDVPVVCLQCDPAPCSEACPVGAIVQASFGAWVVDKDKCTACGLCVDACQYGMIAIENQEQECARKCDLCQGNPMCVQYCPTKALML